MTYLLVDTLTALWRQFKLPDAYGLSPVYSPLRTFKTPSTTEFDAIAFGCLYPSIECGVRSVGRQLVLSLSVFVAPAQT